MDLEPLRRPPLCEWATLGALGAACGVAALGLLAGRLPVGSLALHAALLGGFGAWMALSAPARRRGAGWTAALRPALVVGSLWTLYSTLATLPFAVIPWDADPWIAGADRALCGGASPSLWAERWERLCLVEGAALIYGLFIPYLYLAVALGSWTGDRGGRARFLDGLALVYAIGFAGYILLPARGPIVELAGSFAGEMQGGFFLGLVHDGIDRVGGPHGAMPSLHAGVALYACLSELGRGRRLGWAYLPLAALIFPAAFFLRYHYLADLAVGAGIAAAAIWWTGRGSLREPAGAARVIPDGQADGFAG